jgi:hypothetical protein
MAVLPRRFPEAGCHYALGLARLGMASKFWHCRGDPDYRRREGTMLAIDLRLEDHREEYLFQNAGLPQRVLAFRCGGDRDSVIFRLSNECFHLRSSKTGGSLRTLGAQRAILLSLVVAAAVCGISESAVRIGLD